MDKRRSLADTTNSSSSNLPQTSTGRIVKKATAKKTTAIAPAAISFLTENYSNKGKNFN